MLILFLAASLLENLNSSKDNPRKRCYYARHYPSLHHSFSCSLVLAASFISRHCSSVLNWEDRPSFEMLAKTGGWHLFSGRGALLKLGILEKCAIYKFGDPLLCSASCIRMQIRTQFFNSFYLWECFLTSDELVDFFQKETKSKVQNMCGEKNIFRKNIEMLFKYTSLHILNLYKPQINARIGGNRSPSTCHGARNRLTLIMSSNQLQLRTCYLFYIASDYSAYSLSHSVFLEAGACNNSQWILGRILKQYHSVQSRGAQMRPKYPVILYTDSV